MKKSIQSRKEEVRRHWEKIREHVSQRPSPFAGMTKDEAIEAIRKVRKELWEKKIGACA